MEESKDAKFIFNKYAGRYEEKYMHLALYAETLDLFISFLKRKDANILDLGCGPGNITRFLLYRCPDLNILGIDISENMIALAQKNNPEAQFKILDCREMGNLDKKFDAIIGGFVLPYLDEEEVTKLINDLYRLLNPGGLIYLSAMGSKNNNDSLQVSSSGKEDVLKTHYYSLDFLFSILDKNQFEIKHSETLYNPNNKEAIKDLVLIAKKSRNK